MHLKVLKEVADPLSVTKFNSVFRSFWALLSPATSIDASEYVFLNNVLANKRVDTDLHMLFIYDSPRRCS